MPNERIWTPSQQAAISDRGHDLLVSAGAGSGKTAVLTERIIRRLTDSAHPADITRMLIVTFTKAAASELKERIQSALGDAAALSPSDRRLSRQLFALERAQICTIHSFCLNLLKENFQSLGLSSDFRIADDSEMKLLRGSLMNELIEDYYAGKVEKGYEIPDFEDLSDSLTGTKGDEKLADVFLALKNRFDSFAEGADFLEAFAAELEADSKKDFAESRCGEQILSLVVGKLMVYGDIFADALDEIQSDEKLSKALTPAFEYDAAFISEVERLASEHDFAGLTEHFANYSPPRMGTARGVPLTPELEAAKKARDSFKKECKTCSEKFFSLTPELIAKNQLMTASGLRRLHTVLSLFEKRLAEEKSRRGLVDFTDLERLAAKLLISDGKPTDAARAVADRFDEIYIDEYQDVNSLQDSIFAAISKNNRFMVGDVKQSIYAFRGAEPGIFESYRGRFSTGADSPGGRTIFLSDNFRCDKPVIDFTNIVSSRLFTNSAGTLPYYPEDDLIHSKRGVEAGIPVRVALIDSESGDEDDEDVPLREAEYVAGEIKRLIAEEKKDDGSPIKPDDIAILMRSAKAHSDSFEKVFSKYGIPLANSADSDFFENSEVLLALSLLNVIDNPSRDIYLAGLLKSPVCGFTLDELIKIRRREPSGSLFDALKAYVRDKSFEKGEKFLKRLSVWRRKAELLPVDRLVWYLYEDTSLPALVSADEENDAASAENRSDRAFRRRTNLTIFYEYARSFTSGASRGLYSFIRYLNDIIANHTKLGAAETGAAKGAVRMMTIHQSKGLEFPVVFICGAGKKFNESDLRQSIVVERSLGAALKLPDETGFARFDTPVRQAIVKKLADAQLEEEMRVLYVAMTRARERLYVTGTAPEKLLDAADADSLRMSRSTVMKNNGYLYWILLAAANCERTGHPDELPYRIDVIRQDDAEASAGDISDNADSETQRGNPLSEAMDSMTETAESAVSAQGETVSAAEAGISESQSSEPANIKKADEAAAFAPDESDDLSMLPEKELAALLDERFGFVYPYADAARLPAKLSVSDLYPELLDEDAAALEEAADDAADTQDENDSKQKPSRFRRMPAFLSGEAAKTASAAERGTSTHLFMQFCDFKRFSAGMRLDDALKAVDAEAERLTEKRFINERIASLVDRRRAAVFFTGELFAEISASPDVRRETRFNVELPASDFTSDAELKRRLAGEKILVQGVMDCFYEAADGTLVLVDYKTDRIPKGMPVRDAEELLSERHRLQLSYYRAALEKISRKKVSKTLIYSFSLGKSVEIF